MTEIRRRIDSTAEEPRRNGPHGPIWLATATVLVVLLARISGAQRVPLAVQCHEQRLDRAERATCTSPGLMQLTADVDSATKRLERMLSGVDREALIDTEGPLRTTRNACANGTDVSTCVDRLLRARIAALGAATARPSSIRDEIAKYKYLNAAFVRRWGEQLVGSRIHLWGCLVLDPADGVRSGRRGTVSNSCATTDEPRVAVALPRLPPERAAFYAKQPTRYWEGTIARRDDGSVVVIAKL